MNDEIIQVVVIDSVNGDVGVLDEALSALELNPSSYSNLETGMAGTYLVAEDAAAAQELAEQIRTYLEYWTDMLSAPVKVSTTEMHKQDWANSWKKNFHTFRASERLVVKPSWEDYSAQPGDIVLPIDPGMCFGTGYHGTTKACLCFLDKLQKEHGKMSFIDAGTGSGILSIGAGLLGYGPICAFDNDPQCLGTAQENLQLAGVKDVSVECAALGEYVAKQPADVVAANILAVVLLNLSSDVVELARPGGYLILSGILSNQYEDILKTFTSLGCQELERMTINEWTSGLYRRP